QPSGVVDEVKDIVDFRMQIADCGFQVGNRSAPQLNEENLDHSFSGGPVSPISRCSTANDSSSAIGPSASKVSTTFGSNSIPAHSAKSSRASSFVIAGRYGRRSVKAAYESATRRIR